MAILEVHVTFPNAEEARALSRAAVDQRLAACANIPSAMLSFYWWEEGVKTENEVAVVFKTAAKSVDALIAFLSRHHSYQVPAIVVHGPLRTTTAYEEWVEKETRA